MAGTNGATKPSTEMLDLDALERDQSVEPLSFRLGGQVFTMAHPSDLDWHHQTTFDGGDLGAIMPLLLGDQYEAFAKHDLPGWKLDALMIAWGKHVGIDMGELEASSAFSVPTVKPSRRTSGGTTKSGSRTSRRGR